MAEGEVRFRCRDRRRTPWRAAGSLPCAGMTRIRCGGC